MEINKEELDEVTNMVAMLVTSIEGMFDKIIESKIPQLTAKMCMKYYKEFVDVGFDEEQAFNLVVVSIKTIGETKK